MLLTSTMMRGSVMLRLMDTLVLLSPPPPPPACLPVGPSTTLPANHNRTFPSAWNWLRPAMPLLTYSQGRKQPRK